MQIFATIIIRNYTISTKLENSTIILTQQKLTSFIKADRASLIKTSCNLQRSADYKELEHSNPTSKEFFSTKQLCYFLNKYPLTTSNRSGLLLRESILFIFGLEILIRNTFGTKIRMSRLPIIIHLNQEQDEL